MRTLIRCGVLTCAVALGACGTEPNLATPQLDADVALVVADNTGEDVDIMREPVFFSSMAGFGPIASPPAIGPGFGEFRPANCPFNATTNRLECPTITRGNLTITRSYAFWDAANAVQQAFDALTTAKANIKTTVDGERTLPNWSATVHRSRDFTATGLAGEETQRTWNGTGESEVNHSRHTENGPERSYNIACDLTVTNVVVPVPHGEDSWPLSGSITRHCTVTFVGGPRDGQTVEKTATITFNGTQTVTVTIGGKTFDIDLRSRHRGEHGG